MWKKAFILLLSFNLVVVVAAAIAWASLPTVKANYIKSEPKSAPIENPAKVQLSLGQDTVNAYLQYALANQKDIKDVLSYAKVGFKQNWDLQLGIKLSDKVIPCNVTFVPTVLNGNLQLHLLQASLGQVSVPSSALFLVFNHLPWPQWIHVDAAHENVNVNFSERPQNPYGVKVLSYNEQTRLLTLMITIAPKSLAVAKIP